MKQFHIFFISLMLFVLASLMYAAYLPYMPYKANATVIEVEGTLRFNNIPTDKIAEEWKRGWINSLHELKEEFKDESYLASSFTQYEIIELDFLPIK